MPTAFATQAENLLAGTFLARAVYGAEYIAPAFWVGGDDDAEKADDYRGYVESQGGWQVLDASDLPTFNDRGGDAGFTANGLYDARVLTDTTNSFDAQGLLAVKDGNTLVMTFRGTDGKDPAVESGQAFTGSGLAEHYKGFKPLINAALDYLKAHPEITEVVVSGHSLGAAVADVFALVDADRFEAVRPGHVTIVSLASSGVPPDLANYITGINPAVATIVDKVVLDAMGIEITTKEITAIHRPAGYFSITNSEDRPHFADYFPDIPEDFGLIPILTLKDNLQFGGDTIFDMPNLSNSDVEYYDPLEHPFDFRGMGAEHNSSLLWTNLEALVHDDLFRFYGGQNLIAGITDYYSVPDYDGSPVALYEGYIYRDDVTAKDDSGIYSLFGTAKADFILGMAGRDRLLGAAGADCLSGGTGTDTILGGRGNDLISGGRGADVLSGNQGADRFCFTSAAQSSGRGIDAITDFADGEDLIDVSVIDASVSGVGVQDFVFQNGPSFTGEGQIRAVQLANGDTELRFNTSSAAGAEMTIVLRNVDASTLSIADFIV